MTHRWAIDLDGVITANPAALSWLTYHLAKKDNDNHITVITWRDGSNNHRRLETLADLTRFGIVYDELVMAPRHFSNAKVAAYWKIKIFNDLKINTVLDDEIKSWRRDYGIPVEKLLHNVNLVTI